MNFLLKIFTFLPTNFFFNTKNFLNFSGGQDSHFLLVLLCHLQRQQTFSLFVGYKNHNLQPTNFYCEFFCFQLTYLYSFPLAIGLIPFEKQSEYFLKEYRYDLVFREQKYYKVPNLVISHSQTDLIESKFVEFFQKIRFSFFQEFRFVPDINFLLVSWPNNKNLNKQPRFQNNEFIRYKKQELNQLSLCNSDPIVICRPTFFLPRFVIFKWITKMQMPVQNDETNFFISYLHNSARHEFLPFFRVLKGPNFEQKIFQNLLFQNQRYSKQDVLQRQFQHCLFQNKNILIFHLDPNFEQKYDSLVERLLFLNFLLKINFSQKELLLFRVNQTNTQFVLVRSSFPQIFLMNHFLVVRFG